MSRRDRSRAPRVVVLGAGMAGLACAETLRRVGVTPCVLDEGMRPGGRLGSQRPDHGVVFDHGAQFFSVREPSFAAAVAELEATGRVARWQPRGGVQSECWYVGVPTMDTLLQPWASALPLQPGTRVVAASRCGTGWRLRSAAGSVVEADIVVATIPAPRARRLWAREADLAAALAAVSMLPCWSLQVTWPRSPCSGVDLLRPRAGALAWAACQGSRPGRRGADGAWLLHADAHWSAAHADADPETVTATLLDAFAAAVGSTVPPPRATSAQLWRHARTQQPLGRPLLASADRSLLMGGDWCLGARLEYAFLSGRALAAAVLEVLA